MDESAIENVNIRNRLIQIAEEYTILMAKFWPNAKFALDEATADNNSETERFMLLFDILMVNAVFDWAIYDILFIALTSYLCHPKTDQAHICLYRIMCAISTNKLLYSIPLFTRGARDRQLTSSYTCIRLNLSC